MVRTAAYPSKPIRIVTSGGGGTADGAARVLARGLVTAMGQPVSVENRANATIPIVEAARALPDGHTLLVSGGALWMASAVQDKTPQYDFDAFAPITCVASAPNVLVVHPSLPVESVADLIALARSRPGELVYSTGAPGSSSYFAAELFQRLTGVHIVRADYENSASMLDDLLAGSVQLLFGTAGVVKSHIASAKLKAIAVTSAQPSVLFPDLPTIAASGLPGFESVTRIGLFAPAKTPGAIIDVLNRASVRVLESAHAREALHHMGMDAAGSSSEAFVQSIRSEIAQRSIS